ncbi:hypothetical protein KUTeg_009107 [Tegillarca granosa]|uniref:Uncharacterized protein n=1 Tax=Tegillarca granosa TaxID=220873 RepID=A0ABQ9F9P3_TEGGR|nr:hypothetical protein KUTeg_009107 [Tegillarca granosa]
METLRTVLVNLFCVQHSEELFKLQTYFTDTTGLHVLYNGQKSEEHVIIQTYLDTTGQYDRTVDNILRNFIR